MLMVSTRLSRYAQVVSLRSFTGRAALFWLFTPWVMPPLLQFADVTLSRYLLRGEKTRWNRVRLARGLGTGAANLVIKALGSNMTSVVPSRYGVFNSYLTSPRDVNASRSACVGIIQVQLVLDKTAIFHGLQIKGRGVNTLYKHCGLIIS